MSGKIGGDLKKASPSYGGYLDVFGPHLVVLLASQDPAEDATRGGFLGVSAVHLRFRIVRVVSQIPQVIGCNRIYPSMIGILSIPRFPRTPIVSGALHPRVISSKSQTDEPPETKLG